MGCTNCIRNSNEQAISCNEHSSFDNDLLDSKEVQQLHLQELMCGQMKGSLGHLWELTRNNSCICDHMMGPHMVIWNVVHVKNFILIYHGFWEQVTKVCKNCRYVIMRKTMITNLRWQLDGRLLIFIQLVWFILLVMHVQVDVDSLNKGILFKFF